MKKRHILALGGLAAPMLAVLITRLHGYDPTTDVDSSRASVGPSAAHWLGTDHLGRDVAWRVVAASEAFVAPALGACLVAFVLGVGGGAVAGWFGGPIASAIRYAFTVVSSLPRFVIILLACAVYGNHPAVLSLIAGVAYVPTVGEAVFTRIEAFRSAEFVLAAEAHGVHPLRVLLYHLLWVSGRKLVARHLLHLFGYFVVLETTLSYIGGFGVAEPQPSWGNMLAFEWGMRDGNPWAARAPAVALWLVVLSAAVLAEALGEGEDG